VPLSRKTYARRSARDKFEIITPNRIYLLKELTPGDSNEWITAINLVIDTFCNDE
jgi:hypothetical protein